MSRAAKLKVYRAAIGFHDAYVAASSKKAALQAWGSDKDLFARGATELVTDETLTDEPLASPGKVIKRLRGTAEEQVAALPPDRPKRPGKVKPAEPMTEATSTSADAQRKIKKRPKSQPKPRPSRAALDQAEQAVADAERKQADELAELRHREEALARERRELTARQADEIRKLMQVRDCAEAAHGKAMTKWRAAAS